MGSPGGHQPFLHRHLPGWKAATGPQEVCRLEDRRHSESLFLLPSPAHVTLKLFSASCWPWKGSLTDITCHSLCFRVSGERDDLLCLSSSRWQILKWLFLAKWPSESSGLSDVFSLYFDLWAARGLALFCQNVQLCELYVSNDAVVCEGDCWRAYVKVFLQQTLWPWSLYLPNERHEERRRPWHVLLFFDTFRAASVVTLWADRNCCIRVENELLYLRSCTFK